MPPKDVFDLLEKLIHKEETKRQRLVEFVISQAATTIPTLTKEDLKKLKAGLINNEHLEQYFS